jgi:hypothetical protein
VLRRLNMTTKDERSGRSVYRIQFNETTDMGAVEDTLLLAILAVGCLHGESAVRMEAGYAINAEERLVVLDAGAPLALAVARVFVGMCSHELGNDAFRVLRGEGTVPKEVAVAS